MKDSPFRGKSWPRLDREKLDETITEMARDESLHPYLIAATGSGANVVYAVAFREMDAAPVVKPNLTLDQYQDEHAKQRAKDLILIAVDAFGTSDDIRCCAIWAANPDRIAWNADSANDKGEARQQRFNALVSVGARESLVAMTPDGGLTRLFVESRLKHSWHAEPYLNLDQMHALIDEQSALETPRFPVCIGTATVNGALSYSAIFAESDEIVPRVWKIRGPDPVGLDSANQAKTQQLDKWMEDYVRAHNFRGAAMAIVEGTRLVYAKGYKLAEPEPYYRDIHPTTLFRMASVSKAFCGVSVWKALADDPQESHNSKMQAILGLTPFNGSNPDHRFAKITVRHLLESNSGIDQGSLRAIVSEVKADLNQTQPLTSPQAASRIAARPMAGEPGATLSNGKQDTHYGSTDYFLLGLVAAKLAGVTGFESALEKLVLHPLKMTRTRGSRSRIEDRKTDEALHHMPALETGISAVHNDRRIVPVQYGNENYEVYDGAGGLSSAVVDVARICAMLSCRSEQSALHGELPQRIPERRHRGHQCWQRSWLLRLRLGKGDLPQRQCEKGGGNPGVGAGFNGTTGSRFIVIARNGEKVDGVTLINWDTDLHAIAATIDWNGGDLFPHFDMPALGA